MKFKPTFISLICFLIVALPGKASEKDSLKKNRVVANYVSLGTGITINHIKDDIMSPVNYYGIALNLFPSIIFERKKAINRFNIVTNLGSMVSLIENHNGQAYYLQADLDYFHLRKMKKPFLEKFEWFLGGGLNASNNFRWHNQLNNSSFLYANFFSISAGSAIRRNFHFWQNDWFVYYQLTTPILTSDIRPNYIGVLNFIEPEPDYWGEIRELMSLSTFNKFFKLNSRFEFGYKLKNGNQLVFSYIWDYYTFRKRHRIDAAYHLFGVSLVTKL